MRRVLDRNCSKAQRNSADGASANVFATMVGEYGTYSGGHVAEWLKKP
jgi:hypothetical protein